jgi:hypothetical protein
LRRRSPGDNRPDQGDIGGAQIPQCCIKAAPGTPRATGRSALSVAARSACVCTRAVALLRLADLERTTAEVGAVQGLRGARGISARHLDKTEATRTTGIAIADQRELFNGSMRREKGAHGILGGRKGKISNV